MQDFLQCEHEIKSIIYDNGLGKMVSKRLGDVYGNVYDGPPEPAPQILTIDFGDWEFEIVGRVTWKTKAKEENDNE